MLRTILQTAHLISGGENTDMNADDGLRHIISCRLIRGLTRQLLITEYRLKQQWNKNKDVSEENVI